MIYSMFENENGSSRGSIEVICGSMFSGKTEELLRRLKRAKIANQPVSIFKPTVDTRYDKVQVVSHDKNAINSHPVKHSSEIPSLCTKGSTIGIDEAQFFDDGIIQIAQDLADKGHRVIIAGLDMDFKRQAFGPMAQLCAIADSVHKIHAICMDCGRLANYSYRLVGGEKQVMLGEKQEYNPLCRACYLEHQKQTKSIITNTKQEENDDL